MAFKESIPAGNCMLKVNNKNTRTKCEICSNLTIKTPKRRHWRRSKVFIVNFEDIPTLFYCFVVNFEKVNVGWADICENTENCP